MLGDSSPIMDASSAKGINTQPELGIADDLHVNDVAEIGNVGAEVVAAVRRWGAQSLLVGNPFYPFEPGFQQSICLCLDPIGDDIVRRAAIRRIVFEAAVMRRIVRWCDDNAVGKPGLPAAIVG